MVDKIKPLGMEVGDAIDGDLPVPTELDPSEDFISSKGVAFEDSDQNLIQKDGTSIKVKVNNIDALELESDGTLNVSGVTDYEDQVLADDDLPNKKYVDDTSGGVSLAPVNFGAVGSTSNKWLEYFRSVSSDDSSFRAYKAMQVVGFSGAAKNAGTATIDLYVGGVNVDTLTFTAVDNAFEELVTPIAIAAGDAIAAKLETGSLTDPIFTVFIQGTIT